MADGLNSKGNKRGMSKKSQESLIPITERSENEQRKMRANGGIKSGEVRREKKERAEMCNILFDEIYKRGLLTEVVATASHKITENGDSKDLIELLKIIKPNDKQIQEITGDVTVAPATFNILPVKGNDEL